MKVLIIGGGGLIGQAIAKKHIAEGDNVFIYDKRLNPYIDYNANIGNDISFESLTNILKDDWDVISNQAALVGVGQSQYEISKYFYYNVQLYSEFLELMVKLNNFPKKILHAGSMGPYGEQQNYWATNERAPKIPLSMYGVTKLAQEEMLRVFAGVYNVAPVVSLRYFSAYSTDQNPLNPYTGVLSVIANQCLNNDVIEIYEDGEQTRDLIHVSDIADVHYWFAHNYNTRHFLAVNVGTGKSYSLSTIANFMQALLAPGKDIFYNMKYRKGDVRHQIADITLLKHLAKWEPKIDLLDALEEYCDFINANRERFSIGNTVKEEQERLEKKGLVN